MGNSILFPGTYSRMDSFKMGAKDGLKVVMGLMPVFIVAGFIESFVTRYSNMPTAIKGAMTSNFQGPRDSDQCGGHWLWRQGRKDLSYFVQMRVSEVFGVDIHPAARVGKGIMIDHAHSIVIGETAVVGDNVSMLHSVTLGGTGKEDGDRHPKIGNGVMIGAGAKVLGNISVGYCSRIAAGSVVLHDVPHNTTVAGVPAKVIGEAGCSQPSITMDQLIAGEI